MRRWRDLVDGARRREFVLLFGLFLVAVVPRLVGIADAPPGLNGDEVYNLIDARRIGPGYLPVFLPGNQGREALYFYLLAVSQRLFGMTVLALRLPSILLGSGAVVLCYLTGRELVNRRAGMVGALLLAFSLWPIMLSRIGLRAMSLTFMTAATVFFMKRGLDGGRRRDWVLGGAALGLTMYTYIPSRVFPLVIGGWLAWLWWRKRGQLARNARSLVLSLLLAALLFAPFGAYMVRNPEAVNQRVVSMTNALQRARDGEPAALLASVGGVVKMFSFRGDKEWRYHLAYRPVFDPLTSLFFYLGLALFTGGALSRRKRYGEKGAQNGRSPDPPSAALLLLWMGAMLLPNAVLNDNPSFIRAAGAIIPIYLCAGTGVDAVMGWLEARRPGARRWGPILVGLGLVGTFMYAMMSYFGVWANNATVRDVYHADLALVGRYLEEHPPPPDARVFVAYDYVYDRPTSLSLALFTGEEVAWFARGDAFPLPDGGQEAWYFIPAQHKIPADIFRQLATEAEAERITFEGGAEAFSVYRVDAGEIAVEPATAASLSLGEGLELTGYEIPDTAYGGDTVAVRLTWRIVDDRPEKVNRLLYVQIHLEDAAGIVRARSDTLIGYPQAGWQRGDRFIQEVALELPTGMLPGPAVPAFGLRDVEGAPLSRMQGVEGGATLVVRSRPLEDFSVTPQVTVYGETLALVNASYQPVITPGAALNVTLNWVALEKPDEDYRVRLTLVDGDEGDVLLAQTFEMWPDRYPPRQWQELEAVTTLQGLEIPVDFEFEGSIALRVDVLPAARGDQPLAVTAGAPHFDELTMDTRPHRFEAPPLANVSDAVFGERIRLLGYEVDSSMARPGGVVRLTLAWQAIETPDENYTVFNHLVGLDGQSKGQYDSPPVGEAWLTRTWLPGEVVVEQREIPVDDEATPGAAQLIVGLYTVEDLKRLPVTAGEQGESGDQLLLQEIEISPQGGER